MLLSCKVLTGSKRSLGAKCCRPRRVGVHSASCKHTTLHLCRHARSDKHGNGDADRTNTSEHGANPDVRRRRFTIQRAQIPLTVALYVYAIGHHQG